MDDQPYLLHSAVYVLCKKDYRLAKKCLIKEDVVSNPFSGRN